jgi:hypothetical protein
MEKIPADGQIERNQISRQKHSSEVLWQIMLPLVICVVVLLVISVLAIGLGPLDARQWGSISLIWLILPAMLAVLITFLLLVAGIFASVKIIQMIPGAAFRLQKALNQLGTMTRMTSDRATEPFIRLHSISAAIGSLKHQVVRKKSHSR